jgi:hypothetical protein
MHSRLRKLATVAGAGVVATATTLALTTFSASAAGEAATSTSLKAAASVTNSHAATFTASVTASTPGLGKPTGTVTFTITGSDASQVPCMTSDAVTIHGKGKAACQVAAGSLSASASPYAVTAVYSGDSTYAGSSANLSEVVTTAKSHVSLTFDVKPASKQQTVFTATVTGGAGTPTGTVTFVAAAAGQHAKAKCSPGGRVQPLSVNAATPPQDVATCTLKAGWLIVKKATTADPHPSSSWTVVATYNGDANFGTSSATVSGVAKS